VPAHGYGPRLASLAGLCGGAYRMSKRMVASFRTDVLGVPLALGEVCQVEQTVAAALDPAVQEARAYVQAQDVNVDETPWREQQRRARLWVVVTQWVRVFCIRTSRGPRCCGNCWGRNTGAC
jgi:transposase